MFNNLVHVSTVRDGDLNEVEVLVDGQPRRFRVDDRAARLFEAHYKASKKRHGMALKCLWAGHRR